MLEILVIAAMSTSPIESGQLDGDYTQRRYVCQANGEFFVKGDTACLEIPGAPRPALCDTVLNNSAWKPMRGTCRPGEPVNATDTKENGN